MNKRMNPASPALPSGMVAVEKGPMREVVVGMLTGNRIPAFGFDVEGYAPNHYRMVPYGTFGLLVGSKQPVEVRVLLDGKLLLEKQLFPAGPPNGTGIDARVKAMMAERPHPFFIMEDNDGKPMQFAAHASDLSAAQIVAEQIHPGAGASPPTIDKLDRGAAPTKEFKVDLTLDNMPEWLKRMLPPTLPTDVPNVNGSKAGNNLANASGAQPETGTSESGNETATADGAAPVEGVQPVSALPETIDTVERSVTWAPSHGLVAVGVRMIQEVKYMEPPRGPDSFTYVLFQLNPWNLHNLVHARLMGRVIVPSREKMKQVMEDEGFGSDAPQLPKVVCGANCGHNHNHNHRRKGK